jgi:hypothetical protein
MSLVCCRQCSSGCGADDQHCGARQCKHPAPRFATLDCAALGATLIWLLVIAPGRAVLAAAPNATITCTPNVANPHNSSHVNGTVNVVVTLSCTGPVAEISIKAALSVAGYWLANHPR